MWRTHTAKSSNLHTGAKHLRGPKAVNTDKNSSPKNNPLSNFPFPYMKEVCRRRKYISLFRGMKARRWRIQRLLAKYLCGQVSKYCRGTASCNLGEKAIPQDRLNAVPPETTVNFEACQQLSSSTPTTTSLWTDETFETLQESILMKEEEFKRQWDELIDWEKKHETEITEDVFPPLSPEEKHTPETNP
ncbi:uncharacterized protein KNAG_0A06480 [Huiozyma naganishii CBS 8797]|uniref:Uncharacterized protein n=1 Tax=Huiozyma naganishii (strain ATCC MYA-139 / BCRC 22969 / CBS 8797 / KCTC 17520 / NBRC 10181 / NCYC 3082 / Yp74L-3) TaxID=1071383 RepID=J7S402_HUIN7|nr:hypothetical protein KNAG_0A06480 [Kazachstania naganishii CBS 8797]CCK68306.1 hypothetical protein KNAG_0A06480 [Kazachstania naganishii CBS 8797]